jgi:hypothetical protein
MIREATGGGGDIKDGGPVMLYGGACICAGNGMCCVKGMCGGEGMCGGICMCGGLVYGVLGMCESCLCVGMLAVDCVGRGGGCNTEDGCGTALACMLCVTNEGGA